uniref:Ig-like domain-containing protein n=1 Tax=Phasianus colchicus TaxID=9054 RepID=A0A669QJK9_PHACC
MRLLPLLCCAALCLPGRAVRGPGTVMGYIGESLSVSCSYQKGYEKYPKYWCYPGTINTCWYKTHIVITSEQQPWAQEGRTSIWDNRTERVFTVTMRDLTAGDAGTYRCGVQTHVLQKDVSDTVQVIVFSGPNPTSSASPSTSSISPGPIFSSTWMPPQQETAEQTARPTSPGDLSEGQLDIVMGILIPCIAVVLFFLTIAATVLVILSWKRKKGKRSCHQCLFLSRFDVNFGASTGRGRGLPAFWWVCVCCRAALGQLPQVPSCSAVRLAAAAQGFTHCCSSAFPFV